MIAQLKGLVEAIFEDRVIVDVGGIGYLVFASSRTLSRLPGKGEAVSLHIEMHVREDHIHLFGFLEAADQAMFNLLQSVQGVGAKMALAVQSVLDPMALEMAIASGDTAAISRAPGVGPKLAARIANELKDKIAKIGTASEGAGDGSKPANEDDQVVRDVVSALVNLGYGRSDSYAAVSRAARKKEGKAGFDNLLKTALKELNQ